LGVGLISGVNAGSDDDGLPVSTFITSRTTDFGPFTRGLWVKSGWGLLPASSLVRLIPESPSAIRGFPLLFFKDIIRRVVGFWNILIRGGGRAEHAGEPFVHAGEFQCGEHFTLLGCLARAGDLGQEPRRACPSFVVAAENFGPENSNKFVQR